MAEYYLDKEGQIYADIAYRLGVIVKQYNNHIDDNDANNFDSTLHLTFLQNLLTIYSEMWKNKSYGLPSIWSTPLYNCETLITNSNFYGIEPKLVLVNNFVRETETILSFLTHVRNALSHPTSVATGSAIQSTGYYSLSDEFGKISKYVFIDSPDVKVSRNGLNRAKIFNSKEDFNAFKGRNEMKQHPFSCEEVNGKFELRNHRIYKVCLSVDQLKKLVLNLSKFLAQPIQNNWNGSVFNPNILDYAA
jgi:hypothetical protein